MVIFEEFPEGNAYWLVKSVDRFRLPHAMSESASVGVLLQQIGTEFCQRASSAGPGEIADLFAIPSDQQPTFRVAWIHAGSLPAVRAGQIYSQQTYRSELPTEVLTLDLAHAERSSLAFRLDQDVPAPEGWDPRRPHRILLSAELFVERDWRPQRGIVASTSDGRKVFIPRIAIFQRFYGPHSEMADALTSGPWDMVRQRLVCDAQLKNGLRTRAAPELNEWHLVLQTLIPDEFRWHVALFNFDEYAQRQVRALHGEATAQQSGRSDAEWFCTATLPFNPEYPLKLRVKGYGLRPTRNRPQGAFLVTSIVGASAPQYLPGLAWARANDGREGTEVIEVDGPKPFGNRGSRNGRDRGLPRVGSTHAPATNGAVSGFETDTFEWMGTLTERQQVKDSSQRHTGGGTPAPEPHTGTDSTAKPVAGGQAGTKLQMTSKVRPQVAHFENLLLCLQQLTQSADIDGFSVVQPADASQRAERGGRIVWDLLEREVLVHGMRPKRRWRMLSGRGAANETLTGRTVLVVDVTRKGRSILLFEVECRSSETGFLLAALTSTKDARVNGQSICNRMMREIINAEGKYLLAVAKRVAEGDPALQGRAFKHQYVTEGKVSRLDPAALLRFLQQCCGEPKTTRTAPPRS